MELDVKRIRTAFLIPVCSRQQSRYDLDKIRHGGVFDSASDRIDIYSADTVKRVSRLHFYYKIEKHFDKRQIFRAYNLYLQQKCF